MIMQVTRSLERLGLRWLPILGNVLKLLKISEEIDLECVGLVNLVIVSRLNSCKRVQMIVILQEDISVNRCITQ